MSDNELIFKEQYELDVLDSKLYDFRVSHQNQKSDYLLPAIEIVKLRIKESPQLIKLLKSLSQEKEKYLKAVLSEDDRKNIEAGILRMTGNENGLLAVLRDTKTGKIVKNIRLCEEDIPSYEVLESLSAFSMQNQMKSIAQDMEQVLQTLAIIEQGQRNDRIALFYSARQKYIEALSLYDKDMQKRMLYDAIATANDARMQLMVTLMSDLDKIGRNQIKRKSKKDELQANVYISLECIHNCTMINASAYALMNEKVAYLATVKSYQSFIEQAFLEKGPNGLSYAEIIHDNWMTKDSIWLEKPKEMYLEMNKIIERIQSNLISCNNLDLLELE